MAEAELALDTPDGPMPAFAAGPDRDVKGGIVVLQEAFGVNDHIEGICRQLAGAGWLAVAPALFHRQGSPVLAYDRFDQVMPVMRSLTADGITDDLDAAFGHLDNEGFPPARCAVIGFCMGGSIALVAGTQRPLGAAVTYYGGGVGDGRFGFPPLVELAPGLLSPWLGHFGDLDKGIPVPDVEALRAAAATAPVPTEIRRYADADHGFNCDARPAVYNPGAADKAWARTIEWLDEHVQPA